MLYLIIGANLFIAGVLRWIFYTKLQDSKQSFLYSALFTFVTVFAGSAITNEAGIKNIVYQITLGVIYICLVQIITIVLVSKLRRLLGRTSG